MKTIVILMMLTLVRLCSVACDCTITPYKPDPPCFQECLGKILAHASYNELIGKYGIPHDIADKIIKAREHGAATSGDWYKKALSGADGSTLDAIFKQKEHSMHENPMK